MRAQHPFADLRYTCPCLRFKYPEAMALLRAEGPGVLREMIAAADDPAEKARLAKLEEELRKGADEAAHDEGEEDFQHRRSQKLPRMESARHGAFTTAYRVCARSDAPRPRGARVIEVQSARDMLEAVDAALAGVARANANVYTGLRSTAEKRSRITAREKSSSAFGTTSHATTAATAALPSIAPITVLNWRPVASAHAGPIDAPSVEPTMHAVSATPTPVGVRSRELR